METEREQPFQKAASYLPPSVRTPLSALPLTEQKRVHEIRLRVNAPLTLSCTDGEFYLTETGRRTSLRQPNMVRCDKSDIEDCVQRLCDFSVHSHQEEWRQGYLSVGGLRAGLGGAVVTENGCPVSFREIYSVCLRVARLHLGCASVLTDRLTQTGRVQSAILCGAPSTGKTSLLRDAAQRLSTGVSGRRFRVAVVDERGELSLGNALSECDVLAGISKAEGLLRAVRYLAPEVVVFDEWSTAEEAEAVRQAGACGVAVITSCHSPTLFNLWKRPTARLWLSEGDIQWAAELRGWEHPGEIEKMVEVERFVAERNRTAVFGDSGDGSRQLAGIPSAVSDGFFRGSGAADQTGGGGNPLFRRTDTRLAETAV